MRLKNSRWTIVMVTVIAFLVLATMVWASPPVTSPSGPLLVPIDAQNAHRVDNHHAASSTASASTRANRVLWAQSNGQLAWKAMPRSALSSRYLNDDRMETIEAAVAGNLLTVNNSGTGGFVYGVYAYGEDGGLYGQSASGHGVQGFSTSGYGVYGYSGSGTAVYYNGGLAGTGSKSAIVETEDYAWRHLYAMESPEVWFEDFGQAQLVNGEVVVCIEPIFAQTVNLSETYHVFLTPLGDEPVLLFVTEKRPSGFTVRGVTLDGEPAAGSFDYRIIGKRLGYEEKRLEPAEDPNQLMQEME